MGGISPIPVLVVGGGGGGIDTLSSSTLALTVSGSNVDIELVAAYSPLAFASVITAAAYANNKITATGDFEIAPPADPVDGAVVNFRILASGTDVAMSLDPAIVIPTSSTFTSPVTIDESTKARMTLQYDSDFGAWCLIQFINGY
jgi:hypothetical protein